MRGRTGRLVIALVVVMTPAVSGCGNRERQPPPATQQVPAATMPVPLPWGRHPILYHRTGGFIGTDDRIVLWPDGRLHVSGRLLGEGVTRVPDEQARHIHELLAGWERLADEYPNQIVDDYEITIHYGGKSVTASDVAPAVPQQFRDVARRLETLASGR